MTARLPFCPNRYARPSCARPCVRCATGRPKRSALTQIVLRNGGLQAVVLAHGAADIFLRTGDFGALVAPDLAATFGRRQPLGGGGLSAFELAQFIGDLDDAIGLAAAGGFPLFW